MVQVTVLTDYNHFLESNLNANGEGYLANIDNKTNHNGTYTGYYHKDNDQFWFHVEDSAGNLFETDEIYSEVIDLT